MNMKRMDLDILLQEGEGSMLEYKESLSASFARELVALANTAGGKILLGVRNGGTVKGIPDSNELRARIQDIARNCDPPVKVLVQRIGEVTVVTVRESNAKPVQCSDGFFWRQGAVTQKLSRDEIRDFFRSEGSIRFDLSLCPKFRYPQDFDRGKYDAWFRLSGITGQPRTEDVLVNIEAGRTCRRASRLPQCRRPLFCPERPALLQPGLHYLPAGQRRRQGSRPGSQGLRRGNRRRY